MGGDLEDKILRTNVPGRYSDHVDDTQKDDRRQNIDSDNDDDIDEDMDDSTNQQHSDTSQEASIARMSEMAGDGVPESVYRTIEAKRLAAPNTGVKGVLADYRQSQALAAARQTQAELHRRQVLYRMATGHGPPGSGTQPLPPMPQPTSLNTGDDTDSDDDALLDGADDFMAQFRQQRIDQMNAGARQQQSSASSSSSSSGSIIPTTVSSKPLPYFGEVICIDDFDPRAPLLSDDGRPAPAVTNRQEYFLFHLCSIDPRVTTIVHAYEPEIKLCVIVNDYLDKIASLHPHVKFLKMMASANGVDVDPVAMPVLSIYREGECVEVLADIAEEVVREDGLSGADRLSRNDVEMVLKKYLSV